MAARQLKIRKVVYVLLTFLFLTFGFLSFRPLPNASADNCISYSGIVTDVLKGDGEADIVVKLKDCKNYYYINRGIDNGHSVEALKEKLIGQDVELLTISHWTPLDPLSKIRHIAEIRSVGALVYTEF
ncbi:hypothetical protein [Parasegetibacter sp. NRK P23]|uniref:hypothetical protein n=1 Tax=Parasegetibacter sp. NRK P23 TaxID=2942999 RepID=UPI002043221E|nr:hypothetical protein [Parasegetibacter sp. NRK P23]MCM5530261.1 hypothetical protein [Parasegetibacter sp. NRK P23]